MKRALAVSAGTLAGLAAVLVLNPDPAVTAAASGAATTSGGGTSSDSSTPSDSTTPSEPTTPSESTTPSDGGGATTGPASGTFTGVLVDIGRGYGDIQVEITVSSGTITDITTTAVPQNDPRSAQISDYAVPVLVAQALEAQSAQIAGLSGATYTAAGFAESLRSAMVQAGLS